VKWSTANNAPHIGEATDRNVWRKEQQGLQQMEGTIVAYSAPQGRRPALYQWKSTSANNFEIVTQIEVDQSVARIKSNNVPKKAGKKAKQSQILSLADTAYIYERHVISTVQERLEMNLHNYVVSFILPDLLLTALLEEAWALFFQKSKERSETNQYNSTTGDIISSKPRPSYYSSSQVANPLESSNLIGGTESNASYFTIQSIQARIKTGAQLAHNYLNQLEWLSREEVRRSRRNISDAIPNRPHLYERGGRIALYLLEKVEGKTTLNDQTEKAEKEDSDQITTTEKESGVNGHSNVEEKVTKIEQDCSDTAKKKVASEISNFDDTGHKEHNKNTDNVETKESKTQQSNDQLETSENEEGSTTLINAHEEEMPSEDDEADKDEDYKSNGTPDNSTEEDEDILVGIVKERPKLDIDMKATEAENPEESGEEEEDDDDDGDYVSQNPLLQPTPDTLLDWMGRRCKSIGASELQEAVGVCLKDKWALYDLTKLDQRVLGTKGDTFVLDVFMNEKWKDLKKYDPSMFSRCKFRLKSNTEDEQEWFRQQETEEKIKKEKNWVSWRFKGINGGYTIWPSWSDSAGNWLKEKKETMEEDEPAVTIPEATVPTTAAGDNKEDLALAQSLANRRSARRSKANDGGVFYGNQTQMSQKQLMDTVLHLCKQSNGHTLVGLQSLVGDEATSPIERLRLSLGRLLCKRNQVSRLKTTNIWSDRALWKSLEVGPLCSSVEENDSLDSEKSVCVKALEKYAQQLHQTEIQLRKIVLNALSNNSVVTTATCADERTGSLESFDTADFEDPLKMKWKESGHRFLGQKIYRPAQQPAGELTECRWFKIKDFVDPILFEDVDENNIAGPKLVERRMRFRASPISANGTVDHGELLILTEAQVAAGIMAGKYEMETQKTPMQRGHPFAGEVGTEVTLTSPYGQSMQCTVVAFNTIVDIPDSAGAEKAYQNMLLLLPEMKDQMEEAFWALISTDNDDDEGGLNCKRVDGHDSIIYKLEQPDYGVGSPAFQACKEIIDFMKNQKHAGIFLEPVDPVALNIPTYFDIIKEPMDITTLSEKLDKGEYSKISSSKSVGRSAASRMLNGPFKDDILLIFDNATTFNPPDDWIHQTANTMRKAVLKKIEQSSKEGGSSNSRNKVFTKSSMYVDEDSDVDMYDYESDNDDEDFAYGRKSKKRKRKAKRKEDVSVKVIEGPVRLQALLSETYGLGGPFSRISIISDANGFNLGNNWCCMHKKKGEEEEKLIDARTQEDKEIDGILSLQQQSEQNEIAGLRRSARASYSSSEQLAKPKSSKGLTVSVEYYLREKLPTLSGAIEPPKLAHSSRSGVESLFEEVHEEYYAKLYQLLGKYLKFESNFGSFSNNSFPPYLGRVVPASLDSGDCSWEIRSEYVVPALRWVIRGLVNSGHLTSLEALSLDSPLTSGVIITSDIYYHDSSQSPFDVLEVRRKKKDDGGANDSSEDEIELSQYEKLRADRVARNAERLKMLGLA